MCGPPLHCGVMSDAVIEKRAADPKAGEWAERIASQQRSGITVNPFCREQGLTEYSSYAGRAEELREGVSATVARSFFPATATT
jgi:hypothetical protein